MNTDPPRQAKHVSMFVHKIRRNRFAGDRDLGLISLVCPNDLVMQHDNEASVDLQNINMKMVEQESKAEKGSQSSVGRKSKFRCTITVSDYCRLVNPEEYFNDHLIDFWMLW